MEEISEKEPNALGSISDATQAVEQEFIKAYEKLPILWDRKHPQYSNKYKRNAAHDILAEILKKLNSTATRLLVRQKINILRSGYRKDLRRYYASKTIGPNGVVYEYTPNSWKYHALKFLGTNANDTLDDSDITDTEISVGENVSYEEPASDNASDEEQATGIESPPLVEKSYMKQEPRKKFKYERELAPSNEFYFVETGGESLDKEFDAIGANVACKLKRMSPKQRCHAELLINKVLIYGLQNNLTDDTDLTEVYKS